ncbi:hypothetical protein M9458_015513, partial [Cirrhinus mrigala]
SVRGQAGFQDVGRTHCPLFFSLSHTPLDGDALTLYAFPLIKVLPLIVTRIPELAEPALVPGPAGGTALADTHREGSA